MPKNIDHGWMYRLLCWLGIHWHREVKLYRTGIAERRCLLCGKEWIDG